MLAKIGDWTINNIKELFYVLGFFFIIIKESFLFLLRRKIGRRVLLMQILFTGVEALGIVSILSLALGAVIIIQGLSLLPQFGQGSLIYTILITIITRELGPVLTAFIIIARSGTAIATELGSMVVSHEMEAYVSVGINPITYLVVPRFLGVTISVFILNLYFNISGLLGSFLVTRFFRSIAFFEYFSNLLATMKISDVLASVLKSLVFGAIISTVASYYGFRVSRAATEVPQMAIKAVGMGFVLCILADAVITLLYYVS